MEVDSPSTTVARPPKPSAAAQLAGRVIALKVVVALGLLAGILLSRPLWLSDRSYPLSPVVEWLPELRHPLDIVCFVALLVLLATAVLLARRRWPTIALIVAAAGLCLWDQTRLQPWVYQYLFLLAASVCVSHRRKDAVCRRPALELDVALLIVACTYFYSGLQKCNVSFFTITAPWFMEPAVRLLPGPIGAFVRRWPQGIAAIEIGIGLGLLVNRARSAAAAAAVCTHVFALFTLGPWGHNWNSVVWPWNIAMAAITPIVAWRRPGKSPLTLAWRPALMSNGPGAIFPKFVVLLFAVMPLLSFAGRWDMSLSAALYSGNMPVGTVDFSRRLYNQLPPAVQAQCRPSGPDQYELPLAMWAMAEMNVPDYPSDRVYRQIAETLSRRIDPDDEIVLTVRGKPDATTGVRTTTVHVIGGTLGVDGKSRYRMHTIATTTAAIASMMHA
jgi:uncharacterized membrane protein YphA (DoxX/SURF4 family)